MALKPCRECKRDISTDAKVCPHCGKPKPTESRSNALLLGAALVLLVLFVLSRSTGSGPTPTVEESGSTPPPTSPVHDTAAIRRTQEARRADSAAAASDLATLSPHFRFKPDSVEGGGWYSHRNQTVDNSWNRTYLAVHVAADGRTYLSSEYYGDDWIFHDHIVVRIGDRLLRSDTIPSYSPLNVRTNSSGSVWETLHFTSGQDNGILAAIAEADTAVIRVRLEGSEHLKDFVLTKGDRAAIAEGVRLGALIRRTKGTP